MASVKGGWWRVGVLALTVGISTMLVVPSATAAEPSAADRQTARRLAGEAFDLARAGDVENALAKLREADELVTATTIKFEIGQLLEKQDRLVEAAEMYRAAIAIEVPKNAPKVHRQAREQAVKRLAAVLEATPKLTVELAGGAEATLTIDGEPAELREPVALDPGPHDLVVKAGDRVAEQRVSLERGEARTETLTLPATEAPPAENEASSSSTEENASSSGWAPLGWSLFAIGAGGLAAWGIAGGIAMSRESDLEQACGGRECPPEQQDDVDAYEDAKVASTLGFAIGVAGIALAIPPLVFSLTEGNDDTALTVSPTGLAVRGRF